MPAAVAAFEHGCCTRAAVQQLGAAEQQLAAAVVVATAWVAAAVVAVPETVAAELAAAAAAAVVVRVLAWQAASAWEVDEHCLAAWVALLCSWRKQKLQPAGQQYNMHMQGQV